MFFSQLPTKEASLSYLFGCGGKGKGMAVDVVAGDEDWFVNQAKERDVKITHVIDTHVHADHYSGGKALADKTGAKYCLHENAGVKFPFEKLTDNQVIELGNVAVTVLHTPGHTFDSICLIVSDRRRTDQPWFVITGDTRFMTPCMSAC
jgi:glyoxylase-like metal-dependent hydrolase (beta-lactamase superfamily II)